MITRIVRTRIGTVARRALAGAALAALLAAAAAPALAGAQEDDNLFDVVDANPDLAVSDLVTDDPNVAIDQKGVLGGVDVADLIDSDGDGLTDADETNLYGTNPYEADTDFDFITDDVEINLYGTDPTYSDTDADGLSDNDEFVYGAAPLVWDTDGDRLRDGNEVYVYGTRPGDVDSDDDGYWDGHELDTCHDPLNPGDHPSSYSNTPCWVGAPNS